MILTLSLFNLVVRLILKKTFFVAKVRIEEKEKRKEDEEEEEQEGHRRKGQLLWILSNRMIGMKGSRGAYLVTVCFIVVLRSKGFVVIVIETVIQGIDRFVDHYVPKRGIGREDIQIRNFYGYSEREINRRGTKTKRCEAVVSASSCESSSKWKITRTGMNYAPVEVTYSPNRGARPSDIARRAD